MIESLGYLVYIHTLQLNFLISDWLFRKYSECIENVQCTLRTDYARCSCCMTVCVIVKSTDSFFHWVKLSIFFMFSGILKPFYLFFVQTWGNDFVFLLCMNTVNTCVSLVAPEEIQIQCTCTDVDVRPMHCTHLWFVHWTSMIWIISLTKRHSHLLTYNLCKA